VLVGDARERHALGVELAVARDEGAQGAGAFGAAGLDSAGAVAPGGSALGGSVSGPLMPQDDVAIATASAGRIVPASRRISRNIGADPITRAARYSRPLAMTDTEFIAAADVALSTIGDALDAALESSDLDVDWNVNDGILEIECEDGGKLIVNRHVPNREIWVAARSGGFHFRRDGNRWRDTRSGDELGAVLERLLAEQAGLVVRLAPLAAG